MWVMFFFTLFPFYIFNLMFFFQQHVFFYTDSGTMKRSIDCDYIGTGW